MEDIWFNVHRFYQQVSVFLRSKKQSELEVLLECGKKLLCEDIGEEKKQILFSLAGICDIVNDQRALKYWNEIIAASPNDAYFLKALFLKSMFLMRINDKVNGIAIAKQLLEECRLRTNDEYFLLSWEFFGKYYWQEKNYALALEAYSEMFMYAKKK